MLERLKEPRFAADALHVLLKGRLPGQWEPPTEHEREQVEELEYAGELMVVQFFSLIRTFLVPKKKTKAG